ncbi:NYN domain-containing protein [Flavobacterium terrisoli]|uniref:NYN domain-containing protein n=1 Tax=Flavobacterium terrisoli TaxID=3242195 RepID=UPI002543CD75|nr:NYN domain-containing protein [Flavobacterium buctense]
MKIAILIDGDNAQASLLKEIIAEVSKHGKATIRRIYGDWTTHTMNSWKNPLNEFSISPVQKFAYSSGKNSTDSAMIIDAMDILHNKNVDGFCIVSSDSDYTGLAKRIREEGLFVMGIGRKTTPIAFQTSCEIFTYTEILQIEEENEEKPATAKEVMDTAPKTLTRKAAVKKKESSNVSKDVKPIIISKLTPDDMAKIDKAFKIALNEDDAILISKIGLALRQIDPSFDSRTFGYKNLTQLFEKLDKYQLIKNEVNGINYPIVKLR